MLHATKHTAAAAADPAGTVTHLNLITASPGTSWIMDGTLLTSTGLPWKAMAGTLSDETMQAIDKLLDVGSTIASASAGISEAEKLLTGLESHADRFQRGVDTLLADGCWHGTTWRVDAAFGVFGFGAGR